jgi:hypothetical protein
VSKKVVITIHDDGQIEVETDGYKGKACEATFDAVTAGFGLNPLEAKEKPEYYEQAQGLDQGLSQ